MFFSVSLSKDGEKLSFHMNPALRGVLLFFLLSVLAMFLFSFSPEDFTNAPLPGKINLILLPLLLLGGTLYRYTILFDKSREIIEIQSGLLFWYRTQSYPFSDLTGLVRKRIRISKSHSGGEESKILAYSRDRVIFGFIIRGKLIVIDRKGKPAAVNQFYMSFRAFFPQEVNEENL